MPTYDYECDACQHTFELFQNISDPLKRKCPKCGKLKLRRLFGTGAAVVFKGSGFYQTDYRSDSYKEAAKKDSSASKSASSESSGDKSSSDKPSGDKSSTDKSTSDKPAAKSDSPSKSASKSKKKK